MYHVPVSIPLISSNELTEFHDSRDYHPFVRTKASSRNLVWINIFGKYETSAGITLLQEPG